VTLFVARSFFREIAWQEEANSIGGRLARKETGHFRTVQGEKTWHVQAKGPGHGEIGGI